MKMYDRVKIKSKVGMSQFWGRTGVVVGEERGGRTRMYRVSFDEPVHVAGIGVVRDDLWEVKYLTKIRERRASGANEPWAAEHRLLEKIRARRTRGD